MPTENAPEKSLQLRLQELVVETDFEFVLELIDIYISETPKQIQAIASALNSKDLTALTVAAHTLKGSSLNLGAKQMGALCLKFEQLGRSSESITPGTDAKQLENEYEHVKAMLMDFKQSGQ